AGGGADPAQRAHLVHAGPGGHPQARGALEDRLLEDRARCAGADPAGVLPLPRQGHRPRAAVPHQRRHGCRSGRAAPVVPTLAGPPPRHDVSPRPPVARDAVCRPGRIAASCDSRRMPPPRTRTTAMTTRPATRMLPALLWLLAALPALAFAAPAPAPGGAPLLVIHGGAGVDPGELTAQEESGARAALAAALRAGHAELAAGQPARGGLAAAIRVLEDAPMFNAGRGAVFTHDGRNELDTSIMDGATGRAGAAAGLRRVRNPIDLARAIME